MHLGEHGARGDEQLAVEIENRHTVQDAALLSIEGLDTRAGRDVPQNHRVMRSSDSNSQRLRGRAQDANVPDPVDEVVVEIEGRGIAEAGIDEFAPLKQGKLLLPKNAHDIVGYR